MCLWGTPFSEKSNFFVQDFGQIFHLEMRILTPKKAIWRKNWILNTFGKGMNAQNIGHIE
jgi:O-glycosyl hydrolase